jgi:hypothetical protein
MVDMNKFVVVYKPASLHTPVLFLGLKAGTMTHISPLFHKTPAKGEEENKKRRELKKELATTFMHHLYSRVDRHRKCPPIESKFL